METVSLGAWLRRRVVLVLVVVFCGDIVAVAVHRPTAPAAAIGPAVTPSTTLTLPPPTTAAPATPAKKQAPAPKRTPKTTVTTAAAPTGGINDIFPVMKEGFAYEVVLTPSCAKPGQTFTAVMKLPPRWNSAGTFMPFYSNGTNEKGDGKIAQPDGTVTYTWVAQPIYGEGRLVTRAQDPSTQEAGTNILAFRVIKATESC